MVTYAITNHTWLISEAATGNGRTTMSVYFLKVHYIRNGRNEACIFQSRVFISRIIRDSVRSTFVRSHYTDTPLRRRSIRRIESTNVYEINRNYINKHNSPFVYPIKDKESCRVLRATNNSAMNLLRAGLFKMAIWSVFFSSGKKSCNSYTYIVAHRSLGFFWNGVKIWKSIIFSALAGYFYFGTESRFINWWASFRM